MDQSQGSNTFSDLSAEERLIIGKNHIKETAAFINKIDLREITDELPDLFIASLKTADYIIKSVEGSEVGSRHIRSADVLSHIIHDAISELQIVGYILKERHDLDITEKVESMRLVNKSLYNCRIYLKEALRNFLI